MESTDLSFGSLIRRSWDLLKKHWLFFLGFIAVAAIVYVGMIFLIGFIGVEQQWAIAALAVIALLLLITIFIGLIASSIKAARDFPLSYSDLFGNYRKLFPFIFGYILYLVIVAVGYVLFIIPGVIWQLKYMLWPYFMIEKKQGILESFESSAKATDGYKWDMFALYYVWFIFAYFAILIPLFVTSFAAGLLGDGAQGILSYLIMGVAALAGIGCLGVTLGLLILGSLYFADIYRRRT